jgi:hypothetical protein
MNTQFKALRELVELDYDWYVRCDPDTVVNENMLMYELREMSNVTYPVAYGKYGYGRKNEQPFLEISYYLQGGFCDTFNRATALVLRTRLEACRKWSWQHIPRKYLHSDVEISRCMLRNNVSLRNWPAKLTHPTYKISRARKKVLIDPTLDQICRHTSKALFAHPAKTPSIYYVRRMLLDQDRHPCFFVQTHVKLPMPSFMLNGTLSASPFFERAVNMVPKPGKHSHFFTKGEMGYKDTMHRILRRALSSDLSHFATFDRDVGFHKSAWQYMHRDWSCIEQTLDNGGVVLLGAAVWSEGYREKISKMSESQTCHDYMTGVTGSFAVIWSNRAANLAAEWNDALDLPFDHVWGMLHTIGIPVKFIHPPIAVHDLENVSSTTDPSRKKRSFDFWGDKSNFRVGRLSNMLTH